MQYNAPLFVLYTKFDIFDGKKTKKTIFPTYIFVPALYYVQSMILKQSVHCIVFLLLNFKFSLWESHVILIIYVFFKLNLLKILFFISFFINDFQKLDKWEHTLYYTHLIWWCACHDLLQWIIMMEPVILLITGHLLSM